MRFEKSIKSARARCYQRALPCRSRHEDSLIELPMSLTHATGPGGSTPEMLRISLLLPAAAVDKSVCTGLICERSAPRIIGLIVLIGPRSTHVPSKVPADTSRYFSVHGGCAQPKAGRRALDLLTDTRYLVCWFSGFVGFRGRQYISAVDQL